MTWPNENSQPTTSRTIPQTNNFGTRAHKPFESKWDSLTTYHSCQKSISQGSAYYCKVNTAKRKQPTNNFLLEDSKEPLSKNIRNNQLIQNEFVSGFITGFTWARDKAKLSRARLTWPTETSQPTIFRSKPQTKETNIGTQAHKPVTSKRICLKTDLSCQTSMYPGEPQCCQSNLANREHPTNKFSLEDSKEALSKYMHIHHYRKTYSKTSNSKWNCPATDPSCQ